MKRFILLFLVVFITSNASLQTAAYLDSPSVDIQSPVAKQDQAVFPVGKSTRYGLFNQRIRGRVVKDPDASTGTVIRGSTLEFVGDNTERIPLNKGVRFGYRYWLKLPPEHKRPSLKRVLIHPEMTLPDGSTVSHSERTIKKRATHGIVTAIDAYALSEDYELVEGEWIFQLWYHEHKLVEQKFITYTPG